MQDPQIRDGGFYHPQNHLGIVMIAPGGIYRPAEPYFVGKKIREHSEQALLDDGFFPVLRVPLQERGFLIVRQSGMFYQQIKFPLRHGLNAGRIVKAEVSGMDADIRLLFPGVGGYPVYMSPVSVADEQYFHFQPFDYLLCKSWKLLFMFKVPT